MNPGDDIGSSSVFAAALQWLQGTLLGSFATAVAIVAVAGCGFMLLSGRVDIRRAVQIIFGCFILFGASSIAAGVVHQITETDAGPQVEATPAPPPVYPPPVASPHTPSSSPSPYDPYAGAAVPAH